VARCRAPSGSSLSRGCRLAVDFGLFEEVLVESGAGVGDLDAGEGSSFQSGAMSPLVRGGAGAWVLARPGAGGPLVGGMWTASAAGWSVIGALRLCRAGRRGAGSRPGRAAAT